MIRKEAMLQTKQESKNQQKQQILHVKVYLLQMLLFKVMQTKKHTEEKVARKIKARKSSSSKVASNSKLSALSQEQHLLKIFLLQRLSVEPLDFSAFSALQKKLDRANQSQSRCKATEIATKDK